MAGESSLVNLTGSPSTWILEHLLQRDQVDPDANCHTFTINTKYFNADVNLNIVSYKDVTESSDVDHFEKTEALLLYCEGTTVCFDKAEEVQYAFCFLHAQTVQSTLCFLRGPIPLLLPPGSTHKRSSK